MTSGNPRRPEDWIDFNDLILDHEHLMHLFLVRSPGMDVFWHLHPERTGSGSFTQNLPAMPAGHYQIFADVVLSSGFPVTMIGQIDLPSGITGQPLAGDDSALWRAVNCYRSPSAPNRAAVRRNRSPGSSCATAPTRK